MRSRRASGSRRSTAWSSTTAPIAPADPRPASSSARSTPAPARSRAQHAVREHDSGDARAAAPGRPGDRAAPALDHALERDGDGRPRQQGVIRARRAHRLLPVARRRSTRSASTTSGTRRRGSTGATSSTSRAIHHRVTTRARSSRDGSARSSSTASARRSGGGLSSYPHPWLMPEFWQFPTVSLGIGAITSIYQARFMKYLDARARHRPPAARCGRSSATARWTSPSRWARSGSPVASSSTT